MTVQITMEEFSHFQSWKLNRNQFANVVWNENVLCLQNATEIWSSRDIGVGSFKGNWKNWIGCQQWRHTGRSCYLCRKKQIQIRTTKKNSTQKQPSENRTNNIIYHLFQRCFKRWKLITVLRSASHDINDKIFNTVGMATAASRHP